MKKGFKDINKKQVEEQAKKQQEEEAKKADMILKNVKALTEILKGRKVYNASAMAQNVAVIVQQGFMMKMAKMNVSELGLVELLEKQVKPESPLADEQNLVLNLLKAVQGETVSNVLESVEWMVKKIDKRIKDKHIDDEFNSYDLCSI